MSDPDVTALAELPPVEGKPTYALRGRFGTMEAGQLKQLALTVAAAGRDVRFDCNDLDFLGGAALQVLVALQRDLAARDARIVLSALRPDIARTLAHAGVTNLFPEV